MASKTTEASLGEDHLLGRNHAVRQLFDLHYEALLSFLRGRLEQNDEASDLAQEAYLRLCRQQDLEKLQGKERSYLFKVATNLLKDRYRRRAIRNGAQQKIVIEQTFQPSVVDETTPQSLLEYKQTIAAIKRGLLAMDPKLRQVFLLRRLKQLSYREIAGRLGVSERTVERYLCKALGLLKEELLRMASLPEHGGDLSP